MRCNQLKIKLLLFSFSIFVGVFGEPDSRKNKCKDVESRLYGRISDKELYGDIKIDPLEINYKKSYTTSDKSKFYDPTYGFSKDSISSITNSKEASAEESIVNADIAVKVPGKSFHRHIYTKYPDLRDGFKSILTTDDFQPSYQGNSKVNPEYLNPLAYLNSYVDKAKADDSREFNFGKYRNSDYTKFLKDSYSNPIDYSTLSVENYNNGEFAEGGQFDFQNGKGSRPYQNVYDFKKETHLDDGKYLKELLEQSRAALSKFKLQDFDHNEAEEFDSYRFRDNDRPPRNKRPNNNRNQRPRRGPKSPPKFCSGPRCNRGRSSRYRLPQF